MNTEQPVRQIIGINSRTISESPRTYKVTQSVIDRTNARPGEVVNPTEEVLYEGTDHVIAKKAEDDARNDWYATARG